MRLIGLVLILANIAALYFMVSLMVSGDATWAAYIAAALNVSAITILSLSQFILRGK